MMIKPDFATRVITALARHERAAGELGAIKKAIGAELEKCPITIEALEVTSIFANPVISEVDAKLWDGTRVRHHLHMALKMQSHDGSGLDQDEIRDELVGYDDGPSEGALACPHCLAAWDLIIKRKEVRHELGNAKRALRQLGKTAMRITA